MSTPELRKRLKAWYSACARVDALRRRICADPTYSEIATRVFMTPARCYPASLCLTIPRSRLSVWICAAAPRPRVPANPASQP